MLLRGEEELPALELAEGEHEHDWVLDFQQTNRSDPHVGKVYHPRRVRVQAAQGHNCFAKVYANDK